jgi:hypothetical protein
VPLTDRFQLLDLKRDEGARTFEAREIATGRPVLVHLFADPRSPINRALLGKLEALPEHERTRVIDRGEFQGGIYLVTDRLPDFPGLREWLSQKKVDQPDPLDAAGAWKVPVPAFPEPQPVAGLTDTAEQTLLMPTPIDAVVAAPPPPTVVEETTVAPTSVASDPGEFTRQFAPPVLRPEPASNAAPKEAPPVAPPPLANEPGEFTRQFAPPVLRPTPTPSTPPAPAASEPGEFTRLFTAPTPKPAAAPPRPAAAPGEFTRQFQAPQRPVPAPSPRAPSPSPPPASQPGEFTQMLQAQRPASPAIPASRPSQADDFAYFQSPMTPAEGGSPHAPFTPPPPSQPRGAGEFTQIFGRGDIPSPPPPQAAMMPQSQTPSANATQVFATPRTPAMPPYVPPNISPNVAPNISPNVGPSMTPSQPPAQGPGEYTRMFARPASLTLGQASAGPQSPRMPESAPPRRNNSRLPLLLGIGAAVLLIIAVIVYFMMRPHST